MQMQPVSTENKLKIFSRISEENACVSIDDSGEKGHTKYATQESIVINNENESEGIHLTNQSLRMSQKVEDYQKWAESNERPKTQQMRNKPKDSL